MILCVNLTDRIFIIIIDPAHIKIHTIGAEYRYVNNEYRENIYREIGQTVNSLCVFIIKKNMRQLWESQDMKSFVGLIEKLPEDS